MGQVLYIDVGNSCLKWATAAGHELGPMSRIPYSADLFDEQLTAAWRDMAAPERIVAASVAAATVSHALAEWVQRQWGLSITFVKTTAEACGVRNAYSRPETLGVDRWLGLIAARNLMTGTACIIDCGTAITCDVLDDKGMHLGGQIAPGLATMEAALVAKTADIEVNSKSTNLSLWAQDTETAVKAGCLWSALAYIDRVVLEMNKNLKTPVQVILTGGDVPRLLPHLSATTAWRHEPAWILRGLQILAGEA